MIENMNPEKISAMLDALPFEIMYADENDCVQYGNQYETRFWRFNSEKLIGRNIRFCHPEKALPKLEKLLDDFHSGKVDEGEFWIPSLAPKYLNRFIALRDKSGKYLGVLNCVMDFIAIEQIAEDKKDAPKI